MNKSESSTLMSIGEFSNIIGKSTQTIKRWELQRKLFPEFKHKNTGYRFYSAIQAKVVLNDGTNISEICSRVSAMRKRKDKKKKEMYRLRKIKSTKKKLS